MIESIGNPLENRVFPSLQEGKFQKQPPQLNLRAWEGRSLNRHARRRRAFTSLGQRSDKQGWEDTVAVCRGKSETSWSCYREDRLPV